MNREETIEMYPFEYIRPTSVAEAIAAVIARPTAAYIAGGTTLVDLMKLHVATPTHVVDITGLPLAGVERRAGGWRIGALTRAIDVTTDPRVRGEFPVLVEALAAGGSPQLRNMVTLGGNLAQRTRCYYFRDTASPCNKREPGSGCSAIVGYNRQHAVLGVSDACIATHPSDLCVALAALDATVQVSGPNGDRAIPINEFHRLPGDTPERETALDHGELITAIDVPALPVGARSHYLKVRDRAAFAFALVSAAVVVEIRDNEFKAARIALGGVATKPWRASEAEAILIGQPADPKTLRLAADAALRQATPRPHNAFKIELAKRTIVRALMAVGGPA